MAATPGFSSPNMADVSKEGLVTSAAIVKAALVALIVFSPLIASLVLSTGLVTSIILVTSSVRY